MKGNSLICVVLCLYEIYYIYLIVSNTHILNLNRFKIYTFCLRVTTYANINKMTSSNLATVFAPTLIHHVSNQMWDIRSDIILLETMISNCDKIFLKE